MNKFKYVAASAVCVAALVSVTNTSFADSVGNSKASVTFIPGTDPVAPVDPENPSMPLNPDDPNNPTDVPTGNSGPLSLDYVSSVEFGSHPISTKTEVYSSTSKKPFIQVSDQRGTGAGWAVTAVVSKFRNELGVDSLPGAYLSFNNGQVVSSGSISEAPTAVQAIDLNADGSSLSTIVSAKTNAGLGTWLTKWFGATPNDTASLNNNVTLTVPAGAATVGDHEATVTWTLTDAPGL